MTAVAAEPLIEFDGAVECRHETGAINFVLRGRERAAGRVEALFAAAAADGLAALPAKLHEVRLLQRPAAAPGMASQLFRIIARERQMDLTARSLQLQRDAAGAFFAAVPPPPVPLGRRLGWTLLLLALRIPGVAGPLDRWRRRS
jgi:hypothetical protein